MKQSAALRVLFAVTASSMALAAREAPAMASSHPLAAIAVRSFFSGVCDQNPARSFSLGGPADGSTFAVCVRCFGIYCGMAIGAWLKIAMGARLRIHISLARQLFCAALSLNICDVATEALHLHGNLPLARFLLGSALGAAVGILLCCPGSEESRIVSRFVSKKRFLPSRSSNRDRQSGLR
jgi:uncharacterized membrane protein